jgi:hypothetical protein
MKRRIRVGGIAFEDIQLAAEDIYIYGYPLLLMDLTRRMDTATPRPSSHDAPVNRFAHSRFLPGPFWIQGYCAVDGAEDIQFAHSLQDQILLTPLSEWGLPQEQLSALDAQRFFTHLSTLMQRNQARPSAGESEILAECARIGYFPSEDFAFEMLPAETVPATHTAVAAAQSKIVEAEKRSGPRISGDWSLHIHPGMYQSDYLARAAAARTGHTITLAEDITCLQTAVDDAGEPLKGTHRYEIYLDGSLMPPVNEFWSLTLYDRSHHLVANDIQRYALGDRDRLRHNPDSSLSIHLQHEWPGPNQDSNWLPAPKESFNLTLRLYRPKAGILNGTWRPPAVTRVN